MPLRKRSLKAAVRRLSDEGAEAALQLPEAGGSGQADVAAVLATRFELDAESDPTVRGYLATPDVEVLRDKVGRIGTSFDAWPPPGRDAVESSVGGREP